MSTIWNWLAGAEEAEMPATLSQDDEYALDAQVALPAHVAEFLALKSASEF